MQGFLKLLLAKLNAGFCIAINAISLFPLFRSLQDSLHCYLFSIPNFAGLSLNSLQCLLFFPLVWLSFADLNPCRDYASRSLCVYGHVPPTKDTGQTLRSSFKSPNQLSSPRFSSPADSLPYLQTHKLSDNLLENCRLLLCCTVPTTGRCRRAKSLFFFSPLFPCCCCFGFVFVLNLCRSPVAPWAPC